MNAQPSIQISELDQPNGVTVVTVRGAVTAAEVQAAAIKVCERTTQIRVLWDGTWADVSRISLVDLQSLFHTLQPVVSSREGGKTALLTSVDAAFGIARWISILSELSGFPHPIKAFKDREEAVEWLKDLDEGQ